MRIDCRKREWENWLETAPTNVKCQVQILVMRVLILTKFLKIVSGFETSGSVAFVPFSLNLPGTMLSGEAKHRALDELSATRKFSSGPEIASGKQSTLD